MLLFAYWNKKKEREERKRMDNERFLKCVVGGIYEWISNDLEITSADFVRYCCYDNEDETFKKNTIALLEWHKNWRESKESFDDYCLSHPLIEWKYFGSDFLKLVCSSPKDFKETTLLNYIMSHPHQKYMDWLHFLFDDKRLIHSYPFSLCAAIMNNNLFLFEFMSQRLGLSNLKLDFYFSTAIENQCYTIALFIIRNAPAPSDQNVLPWYLKDFAKLNVLFSARFVDDANQKKQEQLDLIQFIWQKSIEYKYNLGIDKSVNHWFRQSIYCDNLPLSKWLWNTGYVFLNASKSERQFIISLAKEQPNPEIFQWVQKICSSV